MPLLFWEFLHVYQGFYENQLYSPNVYPEDSEKSFKYIFLIKFLHQRLFMFFWEKSSLSKILTD